MSFGAKRARLVGDLRRSSTGDVEFSERVRYVFQSPVKLERKMNHIKSLTYNHTLYHIPWLEDATKCESDTVCFTSCALIDWYSAERTIYRDESRNTCVSAASSGMSIIDTLPKQISPNCLLLRKPRKSTKSIPLLSLSLSFSFPLAFTINRYHPGFWYFRAWCYELLYLFNPPRIVLKFSLQSNPDESVFLRSASI